MFDPDIWNKNIWDGAAAFTTSPGDQPWTNARLHSWFLESKNWGTKQHLTIYCIALLTFHQFPGNKKYSAAPRTFYCLEIGEKSKVLYNIYSKRTKLFQNSKVCENCIFSWESSFSIFLLSRETFYNNGHNSYIFNLNRLHDGSFRS